MVSTRRHPGNYTASSPDGNDDTDSDSVNFTGWAHKPSPVLLWWIGVSTLLVFWDCTYMLLRPHTFPGGALHWPLWVPYELYGRVDLLYGVAAFDEKVGFAGAQSFMNVVENLIYMYYCFIVYTHGKRIASAKGPFAPYRALSGREGAVAVVVLFAGAIMTLSKTVLYWLCEYYSDYHDIGHNSLGDLFILWIVPNGLWIIFPGYMAYKAGKDIVDGLVDDSDSPMAIMKTK